jgi:uncharacterized phage protein gp47/JayE
MPLSLVDLQTQQSKEDVRSILVQLLEDVAFPVDAWQDESLARAYLETASALGSIMSERVAYLSRQGFLSSAEAEFLTALVLSHYDELRNPAVASVFPVSAINAGGTTHGPAAGAIIVRSSDGQTFTNVAAATISASTTTIVSFQAQQPGSAGNIEAQTLTLVTPLAGVTMSFLGSFTTAGADAESDPKLRERARTKWATLRVEKVREGVLNLARNAAASIDSLAIDDDNPRGPGTVDVYLAAENATAGGSDVLAAQAAFDDAFFGNGSSTPLVKALAALTVSQAALATVYVRGAAADLVQTALQTAWTEFLGSIPVGGFDLSPGPVNVIPRAMIIAALAAADASILAVDLTTPSADVVVDPRTKVLSGTATFNIIVIPAA